VSKRIFACRDSSFPAWNPPSPRCAPYTRLSRYHSIDLATFVAMVQEKEEEEEGAMQRRRQKHSQGGNLEFLHAHSFRERLNRWRLHLASFLMMRGRAGS
jgi:hypothetical protein